jgi:hypothetical protein
MLDMWSLAAALGFYVISNHYIFHFDFFFDREIAFRLAGGT